MAYRIQNKLTFIHIPKNAEFLLDNNYQLVDYNGIIDFVVVHKDNTK